MGYPHDYGSTPMTSGCKMINIETYRNIYRGFLNWGVPQNGWFLRENPIKIDDDWGYPHFRKPPYRNIYRCIVTQLAIRILCQSVVLPVLRNIDLDERAPNGAPLLGCRWSPPLLLWQLCWSDWLPSSCRLGGWEDPKMVETRKQRHLRQLPTWKMGCFTHVSLLFMGETSKQRNVLGWKTWPCEFF